MRPPTMLPNRRSLRAKAWDYTRAGPYFVTLVTHERGMLFGEVASGLMALSSFGRVVQQEWEASVNIRQELTLDIFVVIPNHIHGIVWLPEANETNEARVEAHGHAPLQRPARSLGSFIAGFKSASTKRINQLRGTPGLPVWQRNYYERVIRNERELEAVRSYIAGNPAAWADDPENRVRR